MSDQVDEIKSRLDVVDVLSEYITIKQAGANFRALCPFHNEKTPSFMVSREKQIWHCFGCGEGGDIFSFVMKIEGIEFPEALRILANKAGVELQKQDPKIMNQKTKLLDACSAAADFFQETLKSPQGRAGLEYFRKRGMDDETMEEFRLGCAPDAWDGLLKSLAPKGFSEKDLETAGLIARRQSGSGYYDRFRNRTIFPIADHHGNIVGFSGRVLADGVKEAKYINSPETPIYNKSRIVYGLYKAKTEIKKKDLAIITEGYMDVIASHKAGVTNAVASSGTALTLDQVRLLQRYSNNIALCFDGDSAGQNATKRGIDVALAQGMNIRIIELPFGKDPDECINKDPALWEKAIESAKSIMEYYFGRTFARLDLSKIEHKKKARDVLLPAISRLRDRMEQDFWMKKLAAKLETEEELLRDAMKNTAQANRESFSRRGEGGNGAAPSQKKGRSALLGERLLALALKFPDSMGYLSENLDGEILTTPLLRRLAESLSAYYNENARQIREDGFVYSYFIRELEEQDRQLKEFADYLSLLAEKEFSGQESENMESEMKDMLRQLKMGNNSRKKKEIEREMEKLEKSEGKDEEIEALLIALNRLNQETAELEE